MITKKDKYKKDKQGLSSFYLPHLNFYQQGTWLPGLLSELSFNLRRPLSGTLGGRTSTSPELEEGSTGTLWVITQKLLFFGLCPSEDVIFSSPECGGTGPFWIELGLNIELRLNSSV